MGVTMKKVVATGLSVAAFTLSIGLVGPVSVA